MTTFPAPETREQIADQAGVDQRVDDQTVATRAVVDQREVFDEEVATHDRVERRLLWKEMACIAFVVVVVVIRQLWLT